MSENGSRNGFTHEGGIDVVVIGAGAGGLNAALVLARARRRVVLVDSGAPRNAPSAHMQGFLSLRRDGAERAPGDRSGRSSRIRGGVHTG